VDVVKLFCLVLARDGQHVPSKIEEMQRLGLQFLVVCGQKIDSPCVVYREPTGKWDAINFGYRFVPEETEVVLLNDVDTTIHQLERALALTSKFDLVYSAVKPAGGPQTSFYAFADPLRQRLNLFASGELMLISKRALDRLMPIPPCMAEDSYLLFKAMELNYRVSFCRETYVSTSRSENASEETAYKERTTLGILQALDYARPSAAIRLFYRALPLFAIPLMLLGENGQAWGKGMVRAVRLHTEGTNRTQF
jgi:hypothetical protein